MHADDLLVGAVGLWPDPVPHRFEPLLEERADSRPLVEDGETTLGVGEDPRQLLLHLPACPAIDALAHPPAIHIPKIDYPFPSTVGPLVD